MNTYMSDKEQAQQLKDWWKRYGTTILLAVVVFTISNIGFRYWNHYSQQQNTIASVTFMQMIEAQTKHKDDEVKLFARDLINKFPRSPYANFAAMQLAEQAVNAKDLREAEKNLDWVVKHAKHVELRELARLREARVLLALGETTAALSLLQQGESRLYFAAKHKIMGNAFMAQGNKQEAANYYRRVLEE